ncbi:hypothetical protein [Devosia beringensis]|uniref:hypothetical protein n=1 Tax=Devosia beringensis TaxID=2657486 RepID=UPI00186BB289|nr:hypothetical protein [Devosia beringensis]
MIVRICFLLLWSLLGCLYAPTYAQSNLPADAFKVMQVELGWKNNPDSPIQWLASQRTTGEGQKITKAVAAYFGIPPQIVDMSTKAWSGLIEYKTQGIETRGIIRAPVGYTICQADRVGELSITGGSTLATRVLRTQNDNGLGYYVVVPNPTWLKGGEWAYGLQNISFLKTSLMGSPTGQQCQADNWMPIDCDHGNCRAPHIFGQ